MRRRMHPDGVATYIVDRNINTTNRCVSLCAFCAFARSLDDPEGWALDHETIAQKIDELFATGGRQILLQGGLDPALDLEYYESLFRWMRSRWPEIHIHALSPPEIHFLSKQAGISWNETLVRLRDAGLGSLPGGGAEILSDRIRTLASPRKCTADEWIGVMRAAHAVGLRTSATMVIGLGETWEERIEHLERVRALQDETHGFTAFIPWTFQPANTPFVRENADPDAFGASAVEYLRLLALARLYLDNIENVQASWVTQGPDIAQMALRFGANDLGSTMMEENVVAAAGCRFRISPDDLEHIARGIGMEVARRDFFYNRVR
jgi:cyclic dehypoxanthinyl futalosine synthase